MALKNQEWQCRNCGGHPTTFSGNTPVANTQCPATKFKCVWEHIDGISNQARDWQCRNCGKHPSSFVSPGIPIDTSKCQASGFKHVWQKL